MEVLVTFLGGDVDRPVVTGCLYNAINAPTQLLPTKGTRSGIRTRTTPGGGGYNELTFDDRAGEEQVLLRAQKRLDEVILGDRAISVGGEQRSAITGDQTEEVGGDLEAKIAGRRSEEVGGGHREKIGGDFVRAVQGEQRTSVEGDASATVSGNRTLVVSGNHHVFVGHGEGEGHALLYVNGDYTVGASQELKLSAQKGFKLSVGDSAIEITPEGIKHMMVMSSMPLSLIEGSVRLNRPATSPPRNQPLEDRAEPPSGLMKPFVNFFKGPKGC